MDGQGDRLPEPELTGWRAGRVTLGLKSIH